MNCNYPRPRPASREQSSNYPEVKLLATRLQVIETSLDLADAAKADGMPALTAYWLHHATVDLETFKSTMTLILERLSEWQVSALHDQYNVLVLRLVTHTHPNPGTTNKEN